MLEVPYMYTLCDLNNRDIISSWFWKLDTQAQDNITVGFQGPLFWVVDGCSFAGYSHRFFSAHVVPCKNFSIQPGFLYVLEKQCTIDLLSSPLPLIKRTPLHPIETSTLVSSFHSIISLNILETVSKYSLNDGVV